MVDTGCTYATEALGQQSRCFECPFKDCIYDLRPAEKRMILLSDVIRHVFQLIDTGFSIDYVANQYDAIPTSRIYYWLMNRQRTESKIEKYGLVKNSGYMMSTI